MAGKKKQTTIEYKALEPEQMTSFLQEIRTGERVVSIAGEDGTAHVLVFRKMTRSLETQMRVVYTNLYQNYLKLGMPPRIEARKTFLSLIAKNGIDPDTFDEKRTAIQKKLLENLSDKADEVKAKDIVQNTEALLQAVNQNLKYLTPDEMSFLDVLGENEALESQIMANCAEALAESDAQLFLMSQTIFNADGTPLWKDYAAATEETDLMFIARLREEYQRFMAGYPLFFEVKLPASDQLVAQRSTGSKNA